MLEDETADKRDIDCSDGVEQEGGGSKIDINKTRIYHSTITSINGFTINGPKEDKIMTTLLYSYVNFMNWFNNEEGQDLIEYALIAVLISLAVTVALGAVGTQLGVTWAAVSAAIAP
jgi:Flp pilus assembly pilin Flp